MKHEAKNKILLTGGGTGGSVSPLLAIKESLTPSSTPGVADERSRGYDFLWIGTKNGPERSMVGLENVKFKYICGGKLRRYFSFRNFIDIFCLIGGFFKAFSIILNYKPNIIVSAGSFVGVPVVWAGWILRIPILIHQQDARPGLANRLMAPFAKVITVTLEESVNKYGKKAVLTGNPIRRSLGPDSREHGTLQFGGQAGNSFDLEIGSPVILIIGGGTGATAINELVLGSLKGLTDCCQVIHSTGKDKSQSISMYDSHPRYRSYGFLDSEQIAEAYKRADVVVSRGGMGALTELSYLGKPAIIIPMPDTHQEDNAKVFKEAEAAIVLNQKKLTSEKLLEEIDKLLHDDILRNKLSDNIKNVIKKGANDKIIKIIKEILK